MLNYYIIEKTYIVPAVGNVNGMYFLFIYLRTYLFKVDM